MKIEPADQLVLDHIAARGDELVSRAVGWANINSGSRNSDGLLKMLDVLQQAFSHLPVTIERVETGTSKTVSANGTVSTDHYAPALRITCRPDAPVQVVTTGHYDTVFDASSAFQSVRIRDDGALNGPGIADMKGGISVMLGALEAFEAHPDKARVGWSALLSPDEEIGSPGSAPLLAELGRKGHIGLTYEPAMADGTLAGERKGSGNYHLIVRGKSAHAGRAFHEGANAVAAAAMIAVQLHQLNGKREGVTVNVSKIDGGSPLNVVADNAVVRFNVRVPDAASAAWVVDAIQNITSVAPLAGTSLELHGGMTRAPKPMDASQSALFAAVKETGALLGQTIAWQPSGGVCEGNNLHAAGLPNVDTLGVIGGDIHSDQEYAWPESFVKRAQLSALILSKIATGDIDARKLKQLRQESM